MQLMKTNNDNSKSVPAAIGLKQQLPVYSLSISLKRELHSFIMSIRRGRLKIYSTVNFSLNIKPKAKSSYLRIKLKPYTSTI